jgi:hypothetical protein
LKVRDNIRCIAMLNHGGLNVGRGYLSPDGPDPLEAVRECVCANGRVQSLDSTSSMFG